MFFNQHGYDLRCEWGIEGVNQLAPISSVVIIVDVLSFSTAVDIAVSNGAIVYPYRWRDDTVSAYAESLGAVVANFTRKYDTGYSLAPTSLLNIPAGTRLVLPSPNGSTLSLSTGDVPTFAGCLRNAKAVAAAAQQSGKQISVIPAGERWEDGNLRPAIEDLIGAGAIFHHLTGTRSPEALAAESLFLHFRDDLESCLRQCSSGRELLGLGFPEDITLASALDSSTCSPLLVDGAYAKQAPTP
jgi:2-phosphosulfolactate phosphatase